MCQAQDLPWYQTWFNEDYLDVYGRRDAAEAQRAIALAERELGLSPGDRVLDLCCGNARHSVELAERGFVVVALDLSPALLLSGAKKAHDAGVKVGFVQGDARRIAVHSVFDAVVNFFTSFGYFDKDEDNALVIENVARVLKKRGRFLIDYFNTEHLLTNLVPESVWSVGSARVREERVIDSVNNRVNKRITIERDGVEKRYFESVRLYSENELRNMLESCGLSVSKSFGDYDGGAVEISRPRLILVGEKA
jgi:ubiquinone/menaquinone biosynthesis C-methylase UbiE